MKDYNTLAQEILDGSWGNGEERRRRLEAAGYDYQLAQKYVNNLLYGTWDSQESDELVVHFDTTKYSSIKVILE